MNIIEQLLDKLSFDRTVELTQEEELAVLNYLSSGDMIDNGSSRIAYEFFDKYVVKVGMSECGFNQNKIERDFYAEHGDSGYFAHLFAYGRTLNIMECLDDCSFYDPDDYYFDEDEDEGQDDFYRMIFDMIDQVNVLTNYYGADNGQIGYSSIDDCYKLYDYGYSMDYNRDEIVDSVGSWMNFLDPLQNAIEIVEGREPYTQEELSRMWQNYWEAR